jgi:hypothetical protein
MNVLLQTFDANTERKLKQNAKIGLALSLKPVNASCIEENWITFTSLNDENTFMN